MNTEGNRPVVVGIGELLWDLLPEGKELGGAPANFAYHAQSLGAAASVVSCVGEDDPGGEILDRLGEQGLDLRYVAVTSEHPTGTVSVELDGKGKPKFTIHQNVAWDYIPSSSEQIRLAGRADAVCFGSLAQRSPVSRRTIRLFLEGTRPDVCLRVFDINLRQSYYSRDLIRESLTLCNVLKLNDEEITVVSELLSLKGSESERVGQIVKEYSLRVVAVTKGERGSSVYTPDGKTEHPGFPPERIVDTVGAGDSYTASMVMGLLRGESLGTICENANRLASYVCSQKGAMPPIPDALRPLKRRR
jgi:fructokinase